jgi:hypothetical protein
LTSPARGVLRERSREGPQRGSLCFGSRIAGHGGEAREHSLDVSVEDGLAQVEGDRGDGARGVVADARDLLERSDVRGQRARVLAQDVLGARVQHARAAVVPEARPEREDVGLGGFSERSDAVEPREKSLKIRDHGLDPRLLQHDFADPDRVRVLRLSPGHRALVRVVVREQARARLGDRSLAHQ